MKTMLVIAVGGAIGAVGRYVVMSGVGALVGAHFPYGTIAVNVIGSFLLGALAEALALVISITPELRAFLVVGFLGAFTTFSTFSMDVMVLVERHSLAQAAAYIASSLVLGIGFFFLAMRMVRWIVI